MSGPCHDRRELRVSSAAMLGASTLNNEMPRADTPFGIGDFSQTIHRCDNQELEA
jgi:hypothetical protein